MRTTLMSAFLTALILLVWSPVFACEPCPTDKTLNLEQTHKAASLVLLGARVEAPTKTALGPESIDFRVDRVLKGTADTPLSVGQQIAINYLDGMCPYGFMIEPGASVIIFIGSRGAKGAYRPVRDGCGTTFLPVAADGTVQWGGEHIGMDAVLERLRPTQRMTLTLDPAELSYDERLGVCTFSPDSRVRRARYTKYILDLASLVKVLGARPKAPVKVVVEVGPAERSTYRPPPTMPQPTGGFETTLYRGVVVGRP